MSTKLCLCLILLFVAFAQSAYSKAPVFPGYYIDKNGDSVACNIEYKDWNKTPGSIVVVVNNTRKTLGVADIRGFGVTGYVDYQTATVSYHLNPIAGQDLPDEYSDSVVTRDCFLLVLVRGPYSLYELTLAERRYFFIGEKDGPVRELIYRVKQTRMEIFKDEQYKSALMELMTREHILDQNPYVIADLNYSKPKLIVLANKLNEARTGIKAVEPVAPRRNAKVMQLAVFAGGLLNTFPTTFSTNFATAKLPSAFSPTAGLDLRIIIPGHFDAISLGLSMGYTTFTSSTNISGTTKVNEQSASWYTLVNYTETPSVSNSLLMTNLYFMYSLPGSGKVRVYAKLGLDLDLLLKSGGNVYSSWSGNFTDYHSTNPPQANGSRGGTYKSVTLAKNAVGANIDLGVKANRHRIELAYYTPMELADVNQNSFTLGMFGLYYYYTILK
jgi:hypothetical protein